MLSMMCPGISYSTVHTLILHSNGSLQDNKLFKEFCDRNQGHFVHDGGYSINNDSIHNESLTLLDQPWSLKYDDSRSAITLEYEVIRTFMKIHNISATWELDPYGDPSNTTYQLRVGSYWCYEGLPWECCPPM